MTDLLLIIGVGMIVLMGVVAGEQFGIDNGDVVSVLLYGLVS